MLNEGESVQEIYDNFDAISNSPSSIFVYDSVGKYHKMNRRCLKRLLRDYRSHLQGAESN